MPTLFVVCSLYISSDCYLFPVTNRFSFGSRVWLFSSPEPSGNQDELIVYPCCGFRRRRRCHGRGEQFKTSFPSKRFGQSKQNSCEAYLGRVHKSLNGPGHMTKVAAMLKNAQNLKKTP